MPKTLRLESINDSPVVEYALRGSVADGHRVERRRLLPDGTEAARGSEWEALTDAEVGAILSGVNTPVKEWLILALGGQLRNRDNNGRPPHADPSDVALAKRRWRARKNGAHGREDV